MKLSELHLRQYARVDGSMAQTFRAEEGWDLTVRPDLSGVVIGRKNRTDPTKRDLMWLPFANCLNGTPVDVPELEPKAKK